MRKLFGLFLVAALFAWFAPGESFARPGEDPFAIEESEAEEAGWDDVYVFPISEEDVRFYDKSRPLPEVIRKFSEQPAFVWVGPAPSSSEFQLSINSSVQSWIDYWARGKKGYKRYLRRSGLYSDMINHELKRRGLPKELFYLCMCESGFQPKVKSWAGARGLWQFIKSTGRKYDLKIDYWVDERCDPKKSTNAAFNYLSDLHGMFGDWHLAAASYNCGEGRVADRLRRTGCKDFWCLSAKRQLPSETRNYVPKIISAAIVGSNLERYGIYNVEYLAPLQYSEVALNQPTDLRLVARCANASVKEIEFLNPELNQFCTPPGRKSYRVKIPAGRVGTFRAAYNSLSADEKEAFKKHKVKSGESIRSIAASYGTRDTRMIASMNNISEKSSLRAGQVLVVPVPRDRQWQDPGNFDLKTAPDGSVSHPKSDNDIIRVRDYDQDQPPRKSSGGNKRSKSRFMEYTVEPDDTFWEIAKWSGVSVDDLKKANPKIDPATMQYGDKIRIPTKKGPIKPPPRPKNKYKTTGPTRTIEYTVRPGDRCYYIARHYGIHSTEIIDKNKLDANCSIRPGQDLTLVVPKNAPKSLPPNANDPKPEVAKADTKKPSPKAPAPKGGKATYYKVKEGDSLWMIARNHDTHVVDVKAWNGMDSDFVRPGQTLLIYPGPAYKGKFDKAPKGHDTASNTTKKNTNKTADGNANNPAAKIINRDKPPETKKPAKPKTDAPAKNNAAKTCSNKVEYTVQSGDNLWLIAKKHDAYSADIMAMNNMENDMVKPGQTLAICTGSNYKKGSASTSSSGSSSNSGDVPAAKTSKKGKRKVTYIVKDGDSLWQIARDHDVHVVDVKAWNNMADDVVKPGQKLTIYVE